MHEAAAQEIGAEQMLYTGDVPITVFPVTDGKLGVLISDDVLVLHSPTQKQLAGYLETADAPPTAPEVVLAENNLEDIGLLEQALDAFGAERLVVQAAYRDITKEYAGRPVESPYWNGEIVRQFEKE